MLSRTADALFWFSRYMERAIALLRVTHTHYILSLDNVANKDITWAPILEAFSLIPDNEIALLERDTPATLNKLLIDTANPNSLKLIITKARENARGVQDHITKEVWEETNAMYHLINQQSVGSQLKESTIIQFLEQLTQHGIMYAGTADITMPRGLAWSFMNIGKLVERANNTVSITDSHFRKNRYQLTNDNRSWKWRELLFSLSGYELYLKQYQGNHTAVNVLDQVLFNDNFPQSILYGLKRIQKYLNDIVSQPATDETKKLVRFYGRFYTQLKYYELSELSEENIESFFLQIKDGMNKFNHSLTKSFFSY